MSAVAREGPWTVEIYPEDHPPPHVHVRQRGARGYIRVGLTDPSGKVWLYSVEGDFRKTEVADAMALVRKNQRACLEEWARFHGDH